MDAPPVGPKRNVALIAVVAVVAAAILVTVIYMLFFNSSNLACACSHSPSDPPSSEQPAGRRYK